MSGCAKKTVLKEDSVSKEPLATASEPIVKVPEKSTLQDDEAERKRLEQEQAARKQSERERATRESAFNAQAEKEAAVNEEATKEVAERKAAKGAAAVPFTELYELADIHFDFDKFNLKDEARGILNNHAEWLDKNKNVMIVVEGHCDERGTAEYNLALGQRRADTAAKYLNYMGIDGRRIKTISYGLEHPLDPRHNEEAWAKNRRTHFVVFSK